MSIFYFLEFKEHMFKTKAAHCFLKHALLRNIVEGKIANEFEILYDGDFSSGMNYCELLNLSNRISDLMHLQNVNKNILYFR